MRFNVLCFLIHIWLGPLCSQTKSEGLVFNDTLIKLGPVSQGVKLRLGFSVTNNDTFSHQIKLKHICGCTEFEKTDYTVLAGSYLYIPFTYNSSGNSGNVWRGVIAEYNYSGQKVKQRISFKASVDTLKPFNAPATDTGFCYTFDRTEINKGTIEEGEIVRFVYRLRNCSTKPLIIKMVNSSCGCVAPRWSSNPIAPGEISEISGDYNSMGRVGSFHKNLTVVLADNKYTILTLSGNVIPKPSTSPVILKH